MATLSMRTARSAALVELPMATVAQGTPRGICTMLCRLSTPSRCFSGTGTPMTGSGVMAATMPGRWAAPPAAAMMTRRPRARAWRAYCIILSGVRCALTMLTSKGTPKLRSTSAAALMVGRSESLPMMTPTRGPGPPIAALAAPPAAPPAPAAAPGSGSPSTASARAAASMGDDPVTVTWPTLRPSRTPALPYQWSAAPGVDSPRASGPQVASRSASPDPVPSAFTITAAPTRMAVEPRGSPITARKWFSNWSHSHASIVKCPLLCGLGATSFSSTRCGSPADARCVRKSSTP
mmetsp:Transcript_472/g.1777  ORF Transcript_472/g.1777 Transcript_472/m.1777 type:complete len:293 (+) Transcript_472:191-1069(+)